MPSPNTPIQKPILVANPNAYLVRVGDFVTQSISKRRVRVVKKDDHGAVWEAMEPDHPALMKNGGCLPDDHLRYIGIAYDEFEPAYITPERLLSLTAPISS